MSNASWLRKSGARPSGARARWWKRAWASLAVLTLLGLFLYLLFAPFAHPRTHLVLLTGAFPHGRTDLLGPPASEFVVEDFSEFLPLENVLYRGLLQQGPVILGNLQSREDMQSFDDQLERLAIGDNDVLIVYVSAAGVSEDGTAYVLCSRFDPSNPRAGRYPLRNLLQQVASSPAAVKLVVMEAGRREYDPQRGMLVNEFPRLLAAEVRQLRDEQLWVLCSHGLGQSSHVSAALRRSVFGYFVAQGLGGAADLNSDRSVDLDELQRYVRLQVSAWVENASGGLQTQTPWVASVRRPRPGRWPLLVGVVSDRQEPLRDHRETIAQSQSTRSEMMSGEVPGGAVAASYIYQQIARVTPAGTLGTRISDFAQSKVDGAVRGGLRGGSSAAAADTPGAAAAGDAAGGGAKADDASGDSSNASAADTAAATGASDPASGVGDETSGQARAGTAESAASSAADASRGATASAASSPAQSMEQMLSAAWRLRDALDDPQRQGPRPIDYVPHLWRHLQEQLVAYERRQRVEPVGADHPRSAALRRLLRELELLHRGRIDQLSRGRSIVKQIAAWLPDASASIASPRSLAEAQVQAERSGTQLAPAMKQWTIEFQKSMHTGSRADFDTWLSGLPPEAQALFEIRFAKRLAAAPQLDWLLVQRAANLNALAERVSASGLGYVPWIKPRRTELDAALQRLERQLLDGLHLDITSLEQQFAQLEKGYQTLANTLEQLVAWTRLRNDLLFRARYYVQWCQGARGAVDALGFQPAELARLLDDLGTFAQTLEQRDPQVIASLRLLADGLREQQARIEQQLDVEMIELLVARPIEPGEPWRMETLLATPLPSAASRQMLVSAIDAADAELFQDFELPGAEPALGEVRVELQLADWQFCRQLADLETRLAALGAASAAESAEWITLQQAGQQFEEALAAWAGSADEKELARLWQACGTVDSALETFYRSLPSRIGHEAESAGDLADETTRAVRLRDTVVRWRRLFLVDGRLAAAIDLPTLSEVLARASHYDWWVDQAERWREARSDVTRAEAEHLTKVANAYRAAASATPLHPALAPLVPPAVTVESTSQVSLSIDRQQECVVSYRYEGSEPTEAWVVIDYDPQLINVRRLGETPLYRQFELEPQTATRGEAASLAVQQRSRLLERRPSQRLLPGQQYALTLALQRLQGATFPSRLIVKIVTAQETVRGETHVHLPAPEWVELAVEGVPGSWTSTGGGASLHSFANRTTDYRLALSNRSPTQRTVDVELVQLDAVPTRALPQAALSAEDAALVLADLEPGRSLAKVAGVVLPADGRPVAIPFPPPPEIDPAAPALPPAPCKGLLLIVTDAQQKQSVLKHLEFAPQRPARFLRPTVSYDPALARVQIDLAPLDLRLIPPEGVRVRAEVVEPLPAAAERRLEGMVQGPQYQASLYVEVRPAAGREITLWLHVDDYPRAFIYHIRCEQSSRDIAPDHDVQSVRIAGLPDGLVYKAPAGAIPVQLQVDVPAGAFDDQEDFIEVGLDRDRDREFEGESTMRLFADRDVKVHVDQVAPKGLLRIKTSVRDLELSLSDTSEQSGRANVLARVVSGGTSVWSSPVEVVLDGAAPSISSIRLEPGELVELGKDLNVSALVDDDQLSGVGLVEAAFDTARSGKFPEGEGVIPLTLEASGRWTGKVPTKPLASGPYNLLLRATDRKENRSDPLRVPVQLAPAAEAAAAAERFATVSGTVVFGRQPQPGIEVTLRPEGVAAPSEDEAAADVRSSTTDDQGRFQFAEIPEGKFVVAAAGIVRNKPRSAETKITVTPPNDVPPVQLKLP